MKHDCTGILRLLVTFLTVSRDSNRSLIEWNRNYLAVLRVDSHAVANADGIKSNVCTTVGSLPLGELVLSAPTNFVPVVDQERSNDALQLTIRGSRLHARGTGTGTGLMARLPASVIAYHLVLRRESQTSQRPLHDHGRQKNAAAIAGDSVGMRAATRHKGSHIVPSNETEIGGIRVTRIDAKLR